MNARLHPVMAAALLPFAPPSSIVHQIVSKEQAKRIDAAMLADKQADGYRIRNEQAALALQVTQQNHGCKS